MYGSMSVATTQISELPAPRSQMLNCFHCGTRCARDPLTSDEKVFCCQGCLTVYELLSQNGLTEFYGLANAAGVRVQATREHQFQFVDEPQVLNRLVEFQDER
jgi:P-type Cu+ transporter